MPSTEIVLYTGQRRRVNHPQVLVAIALLVAVVVIAIVAASGASAHGLQCRATVSNPHPTDGGSTVVTIQTDAGADVRTAAHYRTTTNTQTAVADHTGRAAIRYYMGGATPGFTVEVVVHVRDNRRSGTCLTSYLPI